MFYELSVNNYLDLHVQHTGKVQLVLLIFSSTCLFGQASCQYLENTCPVAPKLILAQIQKLYVLDIR